MKEGNVRKKSKKKSRKTTESKILCGGRGKGRKSKGRAKTGARRAARSIPQGGVRKPLTSWKKKCTCKHYLKESTPYRRVGDGRSSTAHFSEFRGEHQQRRKPADRVKRGLA